MTAFICKVPSKECRVAGTQKTWIPQWTSGNDFQDNLRGEGCRGRDQLMDFLLIGWWWGGNRVMFQESLSSIVWFQPVWGLCAHVQHLVTSLHLGGCGVLSPSRTTQKYMSGFLEELGLLLLNWLTAFPLILRSLTSLISNWLSLLIRTQGSFSRWKPFSTRNRGHRGTFVPGRAPPSTVSIPFSLILFSCIQFP